MPQRDFHKGDRCLYRGSWGRDAAKPGQITDIWQDADGSKGYHVRLDDGREHWGYEDQFEPLEPGPEILP